MLPFYKVMVIICCSEEWDISPDSCWLLSVLILKTKILQKLGEVMESLETMKQSMFPCKQGMKENQASSFMFYVFVNSRDDSEIP